MKIRLALLSYRAVATVAWSMMTNDGNSSSSGLGSVKDTADPSYLSTWRGDPLYKASLLSRVLSSCVEVCVELNRAVLSSTCDPPFF